MRTVNNHVEEINVVISKIYEEVIKEGLVEEVVKAIR